MEYPVISAELSKFSKIVVTGPQRSGTTLMAKIIASDLGYIYIDEEELKLDDSDYLIGRLKDLIESGDGFVVQCPALCRYIHEVGHRHDTAIIFMKRNLYEIIKSQKRINWDIDEEPKELKKYGKETTNDGRGEDTDVVAQVKWDFYNQHQKWRIINHFEIEYSSLCSHPLWIPAYMRKEFHPRQTELKVK